MESCCCYAAAAEAFDLQHLTLKASTLGSVIGSICSRFSCLFGKEATLVSNLCMQPTRLSLHGSFDLAIIFVVPLFLPVIKTAYVLVHKHV